MKSITLLAFTLIITSYCYASNYDNVKESFNFRKTRWGMTMDQVKRSEIGSGWTVVSLPIPSKEILVYEGKMFSQKCFITYVFNQSGLISSAYSFENNGNSEVIIESLKKLFNDKYGERTLSSKTMSLWNSKDGKTSIALSLDINIKFVTVMYNRIVTKKEKQKQYELNYDDF